MYFYMQLHTCTYNFAIIYILHSRTSPPTHPKSVRLHPSTVLLNTTPWECKLAHYLVVKFKVHGNTHLVCKVTHLFQLCRLNSAVISDQAFGVTRFRHALLKI